MSDRGTSTPKAPDWRTKAACRAVDPDAMYPDPGNKRANAKAAMVCGPCPVRNACLSAALAEEGGRAKDDRYGIRGGLTPGARYALRRRA